MQGVIVKLLKDLYFVSSPQGLIESKARGVFRDKKIRPLVGDRVELDINEDGWGYINKVLERKNQLIRPEIANVDLLLHVHSLKSPDINTFILDKNLLLAEYNSIESLVIFSKLDLANDSLVEKYEAIYKSAGYDVLKISQNLDNDIEKLKEILKGKISSVSGPSGSGKSSLINRLNPDLNLETSHVSKKTQRGRQTTRHTELLEVFKDTYIFDTPGFSSINLDFLEDERQVSFLMPEIKKFGAFCKFNNCLHVGEPKCRVKEELGNKISKSRYNNYLLFLEEVKKFRRY